MTDVRKSSATFVLGRDAGRLGRWARLIVGVLLLGYIIWEWELLTEAPPLGYYGATAVYFVAVSGVYLVAYYLLGERFIRLNPWINTFILVGPPVVVAALGLGPDAFRLGLLLYVAVSVIANFFTSYGGCEVVGLPSLILKRKYTVYCPLNAVDVVEKAVAERKANRKATG